MTSSNRNVLLIGGAGFVGAPIVAALTRLSYRVIIPTRQKKNIDHLRTNPLVQLVSYSNLGVDGLTQLMSQFGENDFVINLAGILHDSMAKPYGPGFKATHVDLVKNIVIAMKAAGVKRLIHMSALGASSTGPSMYSRSKGDGEAIVRSSGLKWTIFRPSVIFGENDNFVNMFGRLQKLAPLIPLAGANVKFQPVYVGDVAKAFVRCIDMPTTYSKVYELGGPKIYTLAEIVRIAGLKAGCARVIIPMPRWLGYLQAWMLEYVPGPTLMSRDNMNSMKQNNILQETESNSLQTQFGIEPTYLESLLN